MIYPRGDQLHHLFYGGVITLGYLQLKVLLAVDINR